MLKKILIGLLVVLLLVVAAAVALPFLVPTDTYRAEIERRVEALTGRELAIGGDLELAVWPRLALTAGDIRFANVEGAAEPDMARLKALQVELEPWPLLRGAVEVDRFVLVEPEIHLQVDAEGEVNWQFGAPPAGETAAAEGDAAGAEGEDAGPGTLPITGISLGDIRIVDGTLTYTDARTGTSELIEDVDLSLDMPNLQGPLAAEGSLRYEGEEVTLDLNLASPLAVIQGGASELALAAQAAPVEVAFEGQVDNDAEPGAVGDLTLDVGSVRDLAAWLTGAPLAFEGEGLRTLALKGRLAAGGGDVAFTDAAIRLDDVEATGEVAVGLAGERPTITGRLDVGALDLDPYMAPADAAAEAGTEPAPGTGDEAGGAPAEAGADEEGWSDEPIQLPPVIGVADVDFALTVDSLRAGEIETGAGALALTIDGRALRAELEELALYGGRGSGAVVVEARDGKAPAFRTRLALDGVEALPLLSDVADFERLEGAADAEFKLATRGLTERQLVRNLRGNGRVRFEDGAIVGINLAAMVRNVQSAFLDPGAEEVRKTDFAELGGTFAVEKGVIRNDDLTLQAPLLRLSGAGTVDLPRRTIEYRIEPTAAATLEGQGGRTNVAGLMVPVVIEGPLEDPEIHPDLSAVITEAIRDPEELKRRVEQLGEGAEDLVQGLEELTEGDGVSRLIEGLAGGGRRGQQGEQPAEGEEPAEGDGVSRLIEGLGGEGEGGGSPVPGILDRLLRQR